jgi:formylglycine-generating enzyme required for sulfatase activity
MARELCPVACAYALGQYCELDLPTEAEWECAALPVGNPQKMIPVAQVGPVKPTPATRLRRGGSWDYHEATTRSSARANDHRWRGNDLFGFPVVRRSHDSNSVPQSELLPALHSGECDR